MTVTIESITASGRELYVRPVLNAEADRKEVARVIAGAFGSAMVVEGITSYPADGQHSPTTAFTLRGDYPGTSGERLAALARVLPHMINPRYQEI
ncbi:MAG: hypothetical protein WBO35_05530 [Candidatus Saccharimonadales bacterium]